ncbi:Choline transporter-like protein 5 [Symbiodinium microadriaticum]|uniref:Choline transporter-like protein 5 n=1 Tax=Symbiodinium microadriaticum TaxID=2951 RepID=A0A1Q9DVP0_SYMMI|nr:Choline transporter-like protein 5 [Symbiodinium microadriaticum]
MRIHFLFCNETELCGERWEGLVMSQIRRSNSKFFETTRRVCLNFETAFGKMWTGVLVVIGACGTTSAYLFWCASPDAARSETCAGSGSQSNQDFAAGCGLLVVGAFFLCLACQMSAWMETAVKLIQWSCKCILHTPSLFLAPPIIVAFRGLATVWGVYVAVLLVTAGISNYKWSLNYDIVAQDFASWTGNRQFALSPNEWMCLLFTVLMNIWVQGIIYAFCEFVTVYTSQLWYFSGGMSNQGSAPVFSLFRACWVAVRYHLGSIIAGGLKIMVATPFHFTLGWIDAATKSKYNPVGYILGGCCDCCLTVYRRFFGNMTRHAFLDVSLQAMPFNEAAVHVREILAQESTAFSLLTGASWLLQIVGLGLIAVVGHVVVQVAIQTDPDLNVPTSPNFVQRPELLSFAGAALALFIGFPFMTLFDIVSDCIVFCRTMQKMRRTLDFIDLQGDEVPPTHVLTFTRWAMLGAAAPQHLHALTTRSPSEACKKTARRALWPRHRNGPGRQPTALQDRDSSLRRRCGKLLSLLGALLWRRRRRAVLGREDQAGGQGSDAANPSVLTDTICLIPGSTPVTRVEDAPGNARRIYTGIDIRASVNDVWEVLTDYEGLAHVVPNLAENSIVEGPDRQGGARLWQIGQASWTICGKTFHFKAGMTLDVRLHPEGVCRSGVKVCGERMDAAHMLSSEVRAHGRREKLIRDVFPRPFSVAAEGVPVRDITMQNVLGARGDFVHYQGVWRLQPLQGCAEPGEEMMRLTFAVECQPHWFLPVAPVEGRIATALAENMEAIRDFVEERLDGMESVAAASQPSGPETAYVGHSRLPSQSESAWPQLPQEVDSLAHAAHSLWDSLFPDTAPPQPQPALGVGCFAPRTPAGNGSRFSGMVAAHSRAHALPRTRRRATAAELWCMTEAVADALNRAEMRLMERAEVGVVSENAAGALSSIAASMAEAEFASRPIRTYPAMRAPSS